jgi:argininosuccinate synthase
LKRTQTSDYLNKRSIVIGLKTPINWSIDYNKLRTGSIRIKPLSIDYNEPRTLGIRMNTTKTVDLW